LLIITWVGQTASSEKAGLGDISVYLIISCHTALIFGLRSSRSRQWSFCGSDLRSFGSVLWFSLVPGVPGC